MRDLVYFAMFILIITMADQLPVVVDLFKALAVGGHC